LERSYQSDREIYRVIVVAQSGMEVLLARTETGISLPEVRVPRWQRVAENLTSSMKREWGEEVICLFVLDAESSLNTEAGPHYQVAEHWRAVGESHIPTQWVPVSALSEDSFPDPSDYSAVQRTLAKHEGCATGVSVDRFGTLGWFKQLIEWIGEIGEPIGLQLSGKFSQLNASPSFSLIRFETNNTAIWFKAVGEPNLREFPITLTLARLFPTHVPTILASRPAWTGWLSLEVEGTNLSESRDVTLWETAAVALATLQIKSISECKDLLYAGVRDLRVDTLSELVQPFLDVMGQLMDEQKMVPPVVLSLKELRCLGEGIQDALCLVKESGGPDTLGHLDLNPGNIIVSQDHCVFLDWAEAYVGHPFFSFEYVLEHLRRTVGVDKTLEQQLITSYAVKWGQGLAPAAITRTLAVSPLLAVFAYAVGNGVWSDKQRSRDPRTAGYLRGLTRRMNREAIQLAERRSPCLT
jgi:hypothetical protein